MYLVVLGTRRRSTSEQCGCGEKVPFCESIVAFLSWLSLLRNLVAVPVGVCNNHNSNPVRRSCTT